MSPDQATAFPLPYTSLGARLIAGGVCFAVFSRHATAVDLCLYDPADPSRETGRVRLTRGECDVWSGFVPSLCAGALYGYRAHGPWLPANAIRFNPNKLLLDPYALAIVGRPDGRMDMLTGPDPLHGQGAVDNGATALKSVVVDGRYDWGGDRAPCVPWRDMVIYELHVRGFTRLHPGMPEALRGTYAGLAHPSVINYLRDLGITTVQLLPVHQHLDDGFLLDKGLTNYWGYSTIGFFAPHNEYAAAHEPQAQVCEFKDMVKALHAAGIEVILDVVYNHTAEGDERGPSLMFRGLDDRCYYRHTFDEHGASYINVTGCGNAVASASMPALRLILDSMRYWVTEMHVDGFRFDLAVTVARNYHDNFDPQSQFLAAVAQDPVLSRIKLIAEPWDIMRMDSYQVGGFPEPWRELNGKYRDTVRRFWAGDEDTTAEFAKRFCGSQDIYGWNQRPALSSINFLTSHDGFTLSDLVSYASKHNLANGEDNRDGDNQNHSVSCGVEGPTNDPHVLNLRGRLRRSMIATLFCSTGVPFLNAGDERGRTQQGNNNAYCQDNEISWLDWSKPGTDAALLDFTRHVIALRRSTGALRQTRFFSGEINLATGLRDVTWLDGRGGLLTRSEWHDPGRCWFGALLDSEPPQPPLLLLFNQGELRHDFILPGTPSTLWTQAFDTALEPSFRPPDSRYYEGGVSYLLRGHSVACLSLKEGLTFLVGSLAGES